MDTSVVLHNFIIIFLPILPITMFRILDPPPRPKPYGDADAVHILEILERHLGSGRRTGRDEIIDAVGLSEGYTRLILGKLEGMGLVDVSPRGMIVTPLGCDLLRTLGFSLMEIDHTDSAIGTYQVSLLLKGKAKMIEKGVEQRDAALKSGGDGCTTIILRDGELVLPPDWSIDEHSPELAAQIRAHGMEEGDVVLIGGSNTGRREAAVAANSAALELVG